MPLDRHVSYGSRYINIDYIYSYVQGNYIIILYIYIYADSNIDYIDFSKSSDVHLPHLRVHLSERPGISDIHLGLNMPGRRV